MAWARSGRGGVGVDIFVPPAVVTNIKVTSEKEIVKFIWTDPEDITAEGVVVNEWEGTVIVVNKNNVPVDQNDGDVIYTSKVKNQHQTEAYVASGLDVGQKYFYGIFPYSKYKVYNTDESQTGEFTVLSVPPVKPLAEYTLDELEIIAQEGNVSSDGRSWEIEGVKYLTIGDKTAALDFTTQGQIDFLLADFLHDETPDGKKIPFSFFTATYTAKTKVIYGKRGKYMYYLNNSDLKQFVEGELYNSMNEELKSKVVQVKKQADRGQQYSTEGKNVQSYNTYLWVPSGAEVGATKNYVQVDWDGKLYPIFTSDSSKIRREQGGSAVDYFTTLINKGGSENTESECVYINTEGLSRTMSVAYEKGVAFGFCFGTPREV